MPDQPEKQLERGTPGAPAPEFFPEGDVLDVDDVAPEAYIAPAEEPVPHLEHAYNPDQFACVRCGSRNLARGLIVDFGGQSYEQVRFLPKRIPLAWLNSLFNLRPRRALIKLEATACRDCGAVLIEIDPGALRRAERFHE